MKGRHWILVALLGVPVVGALMFGLLAVPTEGDPDADVPAAASVAPDDLLARADLEWLADEPPRSAAAGDLAAVAAAGWESAPTTVAGGPALRALGPRARLEFSAGPPRDRDLWLELANDQGPAPLAATLNGQRLDLGRLEPGRRWVALELPAALWTEGRNVLDLELGGGGHRPALSAFELVGSGAPRAAAEGPPAAPADAGARAGPRTGLGAGEGLRLPVARVAAGRLGIEAETSGPGTLEVALAPIDPTDGGVGADAARFAVETAGGTLSADRTFDPALDGLYELSLVWLPDAREHRLDLRALTLARAPGDAPPLVLFLSADTLGARSMSLHGYERPTTPFLEGFAARAVVFERATANAGWTLPSYASQLTGLRPGALEFGEIDRSGELAPWETFQIPDRRLTLAELFAAAGYDTAAVIDSTMLDNLAGYRDGFATVDITPSTIPPSDPSGGMELAARRALERIDARDPDRPLFLFLQVIDVHGPYVARAPWSEALGASPLGPELAVVSRTVKAPNVVHRYIAVQHDPDAERVPTGPLRDAYDAKVLELDHRIGRLVAALEARGLFEDAVLALSADHGEAMDEQGLWFRHGTAQEPVVHVPLVLRLPGDRAGGRRVAERVELVDLLPTFAELIGLDPAPFELHGRSLLRALEGDGSEAERAVFVETEYLKQRAVLRGRWKLVVSEPWRAALVTDVLYLERYWGPWAAAHPDLARELAGGDAIDAPPLPDPRRALAFYAARGEALEAWRAELERRGPDVALYDVEADPGERLDLSEAHPERVAELRALLDAARAADEAARAEVDARPAPPGLDAAERARLVELGYLDPPPADGR